LIEHLFVLILGQQFQPTLRPPVHLQEPSLPQLAADNESYEVVQVVDGAAALDPPGPTSNSDWGPGLRVNAKCRLAFPRYA
jgi:hypothetical protein